MVFQIHEHGAGGGFDLAGVSGAREVRGVEALKRIWGLQEKSEWQVVGVWQMKLFKNEINYGHPGKTRPD